MTATVDEQGLSYHSRSGRWVLITVVLGSAMVFIDSTVVNVALPPIGRSLHTGLTGLAWTVNAYTLTLAALILLGGSLGDRFGRRSVFVVGTIWFAAASALCALAPSVGVLVAARALQGVGGALLAPGSLAILQASFRPADRGRAIGMWSGLAGATGAVAPLLGGLLIAAASWRWVFLINIPVAALVVVLAVRHVPDSRDPMAPAHTDVLGAVLAGVGLAGVTFGLMDASEHHVTSPGVYVPVIGGALALVAFVRHERDAAAPMLPLDIFSSRLFDAVNAATFLVYAALGGVLFWLVMALQVVLGYSPLQAGVALLPMTVILLALSARMGALSQRIGARLPMTAGPLVAAAGVAGLTRLNPRSSYVSGVLPSVLVLGLGLSITVAPLTATVLAAVSQRHTGLASAFNNAVARVGGLLAVAVLPLVVGLSGAAYRSARLMTPAFHDAMWVCAGLLASGGVFSAITIAPRRPARPAPRPAVVHHCGPVTPPLTTTR